MKTATQVTKARNIRATASQEDWRMTTLGEACDINPPKPKAKDIPNDLEVSFVPMPAVDEVSGSIKTPQIRRYKDVRKGYTAFQDGDVLMAKITPCMENGKAAIAQKLQNEIGFGSTEFHVLRPKAGVLAEYIYHYIRQKSFRKAAEANMTGSVGQKRVPVDWLRSAAIPVPSLDEQQKIVDLMDAALPRVRRAQEKIEKARMILRQFRQSILSSACNGKLTADWRGDTNYADELPISWKWSPVKEIAEIRGGIQKQPHRKPKDNAFPYLRVANVQRNALDLSEIAMFELQEGELEKYRLAEGDMLVVEGNGSPTEIGRSAIWNDGIKDCVHQNHIIRVRFNRKICLPLYANFFWNSPQGAEEVAAAAVTTSGLYSLSTKKVAAIAVPVPPIDEQNEILRLVQSFFEVADRVEQRLNKIEEDCDRALSSVLATAFAGNL